MKQKILIIILLLSLFGAGFGFRWYWMKTHKVEVYVPSVPVKQGDFLITIIDTGILKARKNALVNIPESSGRYYQYKINKLIPEGTKVVKGDPIVWFDSTDLDRDIKQGEFNIKQSRSELDGSLERLRLSKENRAKKMREKKLDWDSAKLEFELEQKKYDKVKRLVGEEILPQKDYDDEVRKYRSASLKVDQTEKEYLKAAEQQASDERTTEIDIERTKHRFQRQQQEYDKLTSLTSNMVLFAPEEGVLIYQKAWRNRGLQTIKEGDMLWPGNAVAMIPDLRQMLVKTQVNETDLSKVEEGMVVRIKMDSIPDLFMHGKITNVGTLAMERERSEGSGQVSTEESAGIKVFEITVDLDSTDSRLRPGMTCKTELILENVPNAIYIPLKTVQHQDEQFYVMVKHKSAPAEKRFVTLGKKNDKDVIVEKGLKAGEEVLLPEENEEEKP